jgi:hypothetical protein
MEKSVRLSAKVQWKVGDRVEGGDTAEDYDTGSVIAVSVGKVTVAWDSHVTTTDEGSHLRPEGKGV